MHVVDLFYVTGHDDNSTTAHLVILKRKMGRGRGKRGNPPPPVRKKVASTIPPEPPVAPAAGSEPTADKESLIDSCLSTPPRQSDDDKETKSESENETMNKKLSPKPAVATIPMTQCSPHDIIKRKLPVTGTHLDSSKSAAAIATLESLETLVVLQRKLSMFMNCIQAMRKDLGADVVAKIHSVIRNTLFKSAKFYPQPSHADKVVRICLYNCNFCLPGLKVDLFQAKYWDAVQAEIIFLTSILCQQVIPKWHIVTRGKIFL